MTNDAALRLAVPPAALRVSLLAVLLSCASGASCARSMRNPFSSLGPPAPEVLAAGASLAQITAAVNQNSQRIQTYQTNNASIRLIGSPGIPTLSGNIAAQRPGRVRLDARTALTGPEVDLGSNDELFWFWVKRSEAPGLYFARHDRAAGGAARQLMPIEPQWLIEALGMSEFKPSELHEGPLPRDNDSVEIKSTVQSRFGPLVKRTVVDIRRAWVLEQHYYDGTGTLLASAIAKSHRYHEQAAASLPQELEIRIPTASLALVIDVGTVEINRLPDNPQLWTMPSNTGSPPVDLGQLPASAPGGGPPSMGNQIIGANWYDPSFVTGDASARVAPDAGPIIGPIGIVAPPNGAQSVPAGGVPATSADPFELPTMQAVQQVAPAGVPQSPTRLQ